MAQLEGVMSVPARVAGKRLALPARSWRPQLASALEGFRPLRLALLCAAYVAAAKGGLALASSHESVSAVWPPTGLALAAVLLLGYRVWPAILVGAFIANITTAGPLLSVVGISVGNTLEAVVGAYLLLRVADFRPDLRRIRDVMALGVLGALAATAISATVGVASLWAGGSISAGMVGFEWRVWWLGDAAGALLVAPLVLVLAARPALPRDPARLIEALGTAVILVAASLLVFNSPEAFVWVLIPILMWIAFRFRQPGAVIGSLVVAAIGVWFTARGYGPFAEQSRDSALLHEQAFVGAAALAALVTAVLGTEHQRLRETLGRLRRSEVSLAEAQQVAQLGSWEWDVDGDAVTWSDQLYRIYGLQPQEFGATFEGYLERVHEEDRARVTEVIQSALAEATPFSFEERIVCPDGKVRLLLSRGRTVTDQSGRVVRVLGVCQDVTEVRQTEEQLKHLSEHDALTGVFNRGRFIEELDREVARNQRHGGDCAVLLIDLDHLKYVNDTLGHSVGDELVVRVAGLVKEQMRAGDVLARMGGDEFAVLLVGADEATAVEVSEAVLATIREHCVVASSERTMRVTASIGVASAGESTALRGEELLAGADLAMYRAKERGRDRVHLQRPTDDTEMRTRLSWSERVRDALEHDRFVLHAQPILDIRSERVVRHELLLRLEEGGELIPPSAFLYVAEEFGMIQAIDQWVVGKAIGLIEERAEAGERITLEVNMSGVSITDDDVLEYIEEELMASPIDPSCLIFEVTETAAIASIEKARQFALRVGELGCAFALDDFGTGFGSFFYLKHLPFDYLKIDGDFVRDLADSPTDRLTVQAIVEIAKGMGKRTIAEFVESEANLKLLRGYGVDFAQGFHIGRPIPVEKVWPGVGTRLT